MIHKILQILDTTTLPELEKQRITDELLGLFSVMQPSDIEKTLEEKYQDRRINDDLGFTGEYRLSVKDIIDLSIDSINTERQEFVRFLNMKSTLIEIPEQRVIDEFLNLKKYKNGK